MQFGITDHVDASGIAPAEQLEDRLRLVELYDRLGFHRYMLTEHHGTPLCLVPSPHLFLAAASQRTSRIRLGTLVTLLPLYNPVRLIEEVGMLDLLSGGRLELGMGRGVSAPEIATYGIDPGDTPAMFEEAYEILIDGLTSDALSYDGRFHSIKDVAMVVPPLQRPRPPLWYGVGSVERAQWAARNRINIMALRPPKVVRPFTDAFLEAWAKTGRPVQERPLRGVDRPLVIAEDGAEARRIAAEAHTRFHHSLHLLWERAGISPPTHFPATFELWQQAGGAFAGTPEGAREFIAEQVEVAGLDTMNFHMAFGDIGFDNVCRTAELFAAEVMPAFAEVGARP
jgi:alkanesulfonate monooxygenase SsuD/methylene tetrahydromethanopterin reductase-like flavin-dependent oxidoreductase (luciferase family)